MSDLASLVLSSRGVYDEVISRQQNEIHALKQEVKRLTPPSQPKFYFDTDEEWETAKDNLFDQIRRSIDVGFHPDEYGVCSDVFGPEMDLCLGIWPGYSMSDAPLSAITFQGVNIGVSHAFYEVKRALSILYDDDEVRLSFEEAKKFTKKYFLDSVFDQEDQESCLLNKKTVFIRCLPCCRFVYENGVSTYGCCCECERFETKGIVQRVEDARGCLRIKYSIAARKIQRMVRTKKRGIKRKASSI